MAREPAVRERNRWLPWFVLAVAALAASLVGLALVLFSAISEGANQEPTAPVLDPGGTPLPPRRRGRIFRIDHDLSPTATL